MGVLSKKFTDRLRYRLTLKSDQEENDKGQSEKAHDSKRPTAISGVRKKVFPPPTPDEVPKRTIQPKRFLVMIHYHYPLVVFPPALKNEIEQLEDFFGLQKRQRGEGTFVHGDRLLATMTYRVNLKPDNARGFRKALCDILDRYGAEVINYQIIRT